MASPVSDRTFLNHYILFPTEAPTLEEVNSYRLKSIIIGIVTIGFLHLGCAIAYGVRHLCKRGSHPVSERIAPVAAKVEEAQAVKKVQAQNLPPAEGKLFIHSVETSVIGKSKSYERQMRDYHDKIELSDGSNWRQNPNDFLVKCTFDKELRDKVEGLPQFMFLPGILFMKSDDHGAQFKAHGDEITFLFEGRKIKLTATDGDRVSFKENVEAIHYNCFEKQKGQDNFKPLPSASREEFENATQQDERFISGYVLKVNPDKDLIDKLESLNLLVDIGVNPQSCDLHINDMSVQCVIEAYMPFARPETVQLKRLDDGRILLFAAIDKTSTFAKNSTVTSYAKITSSFEGSNLDLQNKSVSVQHGKIRIVIPKL